MGTYEKLVEKYRNTDFVHNKLENAVNDVFCDLVTRLVEYDGYDVNGIISLYQDQQIPYLWHVYDRTHYECIPLDYVFNAKTEKVINKFEEVC